MSSNMNETTNNARAVEIFDRLRTTVASREQAGVLLIDALLREAASGKHFRADGIVELPLTAIITTRSQESEVCGQVCIDGFGHHILCLAVCHVEH